MSAFKRLLEPGRIGKLALRNRMVMPPMGTNYAGDDGFVTERLVRYYEERSAGGMGLIIVEVSAVDPAGKAISGQIGVWADKFIPGLRYLVDAVHRHGAKIAMQLHHAGRQTNSAITGMAPVAPSALSCPVCAEMPRVLTPEEIRGLVYAFAEAARRARLAGFDAVELHGTHGYLINQFLSPYSNHREDEYGGDEERRLRFPLEVIRAVRREVGEDYPIIFRMNADEHVEGGITLEDALRMAPIFVENGVDALHVSVGVYGSPAPMISTMANPPLPLVKYAAAIKKKVNVPVIAVGKIHDPEDGERILAEGSADFVSIGRGSITDSHFARKIQLGRAEDIRKCIQCNQRCIDFLLVYRKPAGCIYNVRVGREGEFPLVKAPRSKKVVIVGGGPAGMEAARVARIRGHRVILFEQAERPGGQALLAAIPPHKERFGEIVRYLSRRIKALGVDLRLGTGATVETILKEKPDAVILATGAKPLVPSLPGLEESGAVTAWEVLSGAAETGKNVLIVGGGLVGCETAEFLAEKGRRVALVEMMEELARDQSPTLRGELLRRLENNQAITLRTGTEVIALGRGRATLRHKDGEETLENLDTVVLAAGAVPHNPLEGELRGKVKELYAVGDCYAPRNAAEAIHEAFAVAYRL